MAKLNTVLGLVTFALFATVIIDSKSDARRAVMTIKDPAGTLEKPKSAPNLDARVKLYLRDTYKVRSARYFRVDARQGWSQIAQSVSSYRATLHPRVGKIAPGSVGAFRPAWHKFSDRIDLYDGTPPFAVAMEKVALADGSKIVGYYDLVATK
jgi:hypothetical protein